MTILTGRELEVLTGLQMSWGKLYSKELARLQNKDDPKCAIDPSSHTRVVWPWAFLKDRARHSSYFLPPDGEHSGCSGERGTRTY